MGHKEGREEPCIIIAIMPIIIQLEYRGHDSHFTMGILRQKQEFIWRYRSKQNKREKVRSKLDNGAHKDSIHGDFKSEPINITRNMWRKVSTSKKTKESSRWRDLRSVFRKESSPSFDTIFLLESLDWSFSQRSNFLPVRVCLSKQAVKRERCLFGPSRHYNESILIKSVMCCICSTVGGR